jgi:SNF2 family DNA or RNA helicase
VKTFGKVSFRGDKWLIDVEPHVRLRAKRVFGQLASHAQKCVAISDTIENARDLSWFLERYPVEMSAADRGRLDERATAHVERESLVDQLMKGIATPRSFKLAIEPRDYQRVAAECALRMRGLLLADDVGLGKTAVGISLLTESDARPGLVVTLTHLTRQWEREIEKFAPGLNVHVLKKGTPYDLTARPRTRGKQLSLPGSFPDVIVTSYSKIRGWAETLAPIVRSVVWDEVQELRRGEQSQKGEAATEIADATEYRCGLSATPIYNYGGEIWNIYRFISPNALGTQQEFMTEHCNGQDSRGNASLKDPKAFGSYLRAAGLMLRRTRKDVGRELPEVIRIPHTIDMDDRPLKEIERAAEKLAHVILLKQEESRGEKMRASEELSGLVRHATGVGKAPYVAEFVRILVENGEPVILYGWHRSVYDIWLERLKDLHPAMYTGSESAAAKDTSAQRFLNGETDVMILSLRAGAGLEGLQRRGRTLVFGELDWSPGVMDQCVGRKHRDGLDGSLAVYYLLADEGSDPIMADVLQIKRSQSEGLRNPTLDLIEKLDVSGERIRDLARSYLSKRPRSHASASAGEVVNA